MIPDVRPVLEAGRLQARVLVASTRVSVRGALAVALTEAGFTVAMAVAEAELIARIERTEPHLLLVDESSPASRLLRLARETSSVPIVALIPADEPALALAALDAGADDCIGLRGAFEDDAFFHAELVWRVNGALRRAAGPSDPALVLEGPAGIGLRPHAHELTVNSQPIVLTPHEFAIVRVLLERRGDVVTPDEIAALEWGPPVSHPRGFVQAHVSRVRAKLREAGAAHVITTIRGVGYVIR